MKGEPDVVRGRSEPPQGSGGPGGRTIGRAGAVGQLSAEQPERGPRRPDAGKGKLPSRVLGLFLREVVGFGPSGPRKVTGGGAGRGGGLRPQDSGWRPASSIRIPGGGCSWAPPGRGPQVRGWPWAGFSQGTRRPSTWAGRARPPGTGAARRRRAGAAGLFPLKGQAFLSPVSSSPEAGTAGSWKHLKAAKHVA